MLLVGKREEYGLYGNLAGGLGVGSTETGYPL